MTEIYIQLMDEGTLVFRPTQGVPMGDQVFVVLATEGYDAEDETWEFLPGSIVVCENEIKGGERVLVARRLFEGKIN